MFYLKNPKTGTLVLNRHGEPFTYSTRALAKMGKALLDAKLESKLTIVQTK